MSNPDGYDIYYALITAQRQIDEYNDMMFRAMMEPEIEYHVCKVYGCGRRLSLTERLFGKSCVDHQPGRVENFKQLLIEDDILLEHYLNSIYGDPALAPGVSLGSVEAGSSADAL